MPLLLLIVFLFIVESLGTAVSAVIGLLLALPLISNFLGMKFKIFSEISKILPYNMITKIDFDFEKAKLILPWNGATGYYHYWLIGIIELIVIALIGFFVFRKKEVK